MGFLCPDLSTIKPYSHPMSFISNSMYNQYSQYDELQIHTYKEATKLAIYGEEFSHLIQLLNPEYSLRLKIFVQNLPRDIANKTIYGRSVTNKLPETSDNKRKRGK